LIFASEPWSIGCATVLSGAEPAPMPTPPLLAVEVGAALAPEVPPPEVDAEAPPPAATAWGAAASANAATLGIIRWVTRKYSLSSACGVSCRAGAKRACASYGFTVGLAPGIWVPRSADFSGPRIRRRGNIQIPAARASRQSYGRLVGAFLTHWHGRHSRCDQFRRGPGRSCIGRR
jgi:hypothetical protein